MTGPVRAGGAVLALIVMALGGSPSRAAEEQEEDRAGSLPPVRLAAGLLAGSGYGWKSGVGDMFRDTAFDTRTPLEAPPPAGFGSGFFAKRFRLRRSADLALVGQSRKR